MPEFMGDLNGPGIPTKYEVKEDGKNHIITYKKKEDLKDTEGTIIVNEDLCVVSDTNKTTETFADGKTNTTESERKYTIINDVTINYDEEAKKLKSYIGKHESNLESLYNEWKEYMENLTN